MFGRVAAETIDNLSNDVRDKRAAECSTDAILLSVATTSEIVC